MHGIHAVLQVLRQQRGQDRLAGDADVQADQVALRVEAARQLAIVVGWYWQCVMSSSRDQISLIGVPGISLATSTAWRT